MVIYSSYVIESCSEKWMFLKSRQNPWFIDTEKFFLVKLYVEDTFDYLSVFVKDFLFKIFWVFIILESLGSLSSIAHQ